MRVPCIRLIQSMGQNWDLSLTVQGATYQIVTDVILSSYCQLQDRTHQNMTYHCMPHYMHHYMHHMQCMSNKQLQQPEGEMSPGTAL